MSNEKRTLKGDGEAAAHLTRIGFPCSSDTVRRWRALNVDPIPCRLFFGRWYYEPAAIEEWARRRSNTATAATKRRGA